MLVDHLDPVTQLGAFGIFRPTDDDELSFSGEDCDLDMVELCLSHLLGTLAFSLKHLELLTALDKRMLIVDLACILEIVAILGDTDTEETAALLGWHFDHVFVDLHALSNTILLSQ